MVTDGAPRTRTATLLATGRTLRTVVTETQISLLAAAIAYYGFVSMIPLLVLGVAAATSVGETALADRLVAAAGGILAPAGEDLLRSAVTARRGVGGVTLVGLGVLVWGAVKAFRALDRAFSLVYGERSGEPVLTGLLDAVVALGAVGVAVAALLVAGTAVALLPGPLVGLVGTVALVPTLLAVFLPLYYLFPDVPVSLRSVLPGAALAAVGWTALGAAFAVYASTFADASIYGLLGAVLLVLSWFYVGSLLLLLGAALNAVRSGHATGSDR